MIKEKNIAEKEEFDKIVLVSGGWGLYQIGEILDRKGFAEKDIVSNKQALFSL